MDENIENEINKILDTIPSNWAPILLDETAKTLLTSALASILKITPINRITPPIEQIFNAFNYFDPIDTRVIIIGQDPYPKAGDAHGLCFSSLTNVPPSLKNIYSALIFSKLMAVEPNNGNLEKWAEQGILMLNAGLTTEEGKIKHHLEYWEPYTNYILQRILKLRPMAILMWGAYAQKKVPPTMMNGHLCLTWLHPSPTSNNTAPDYKKFYRCDHFIKVNEFLKIPIDWAIPPKEIKPIKIWTNEITDFEPQEALVMFTDGAASNNGGPNCAASWGVYVPAAPFYNAAGIQSPLIGHSKEIKIAGKLTNNPTNNRAEMGAIINALLIAATIETPRVIIISDSQLCIRTLCKWAPKWIAENRLHKQANPDMVKLALDIIDVLGKPVYFIHMRGHSKDRRVCQQWIAANEIVDKLCIPSLTLERQKVCD